MPGMKNVFGAILNESKKIFCDDTGIVFFRRLEIPAGFCAKAADNDSMNSNPTYNPLWFKFAVAGLYKSSDYYVRQL